MRFKQYITEEEEDNTIINGITLIYDKCMPFIKELTKQTYIHFMYSGRKGKTEDVFIGKVRKNRRPSDTSEGLTKVYDDLFNKRFGWKPRTNSIFCSGNVYDIPRYGNPYFIFPIGKYKYLWSPDIDDMYSSSYTNSVIDTITLRNDIPYGDIDDIKDNTPKRDIIIKSLDNKIISTYTDKNLDKALSGSNEIMINCKEYIALKQDMFEEPLDYYLSKYRTKKPTKEFLKTYKEL